MTIKFPNSAMACNRTGISLRNAAIVANAVLQDFGIITEENKAFVIDKSQMQREINNFQKKLNDEPKSKNLRAIF